MLVAKVGYRFIWTGFSLKILPASLETTQTMNDSNLCALELAKLITARTNSGHVDELPCSLVSLILLIFFDDYSLPNRSVIHW